MTLKYDTTVRGFGYYQFTDRNGRECSLQESSIARIESEDGSVSDGAIWLGIDRDPDGTVPIEKWDAALQVTVKLGVRMHLSQSQVRELLPLLTYFVEHGDLPQE